LRKICYKADILIGSANRIGWKSIIGRFCDLFVSRQRKDNGKIMRYDDACKMNGRGRYRNFGRKYSKEKLQSEDILSDRRTQQKSEVEYVDWPHLA